MAERSMKQIFAGQKRSLHSVKKKIEALACEWSEVDNGTMWMLQEIADRIDTAIEEIEEFVK